MKDGILNFTWMKPFNSPIAPPMTMATGTDSGPIATPVKSLATSIEAATAQMAMTPSAERSIDPIRMMKVAPMQMTSGIAAVFIMRTMLLRPKKFGLMRPMRMHRPTRTTTGAQRRQWLVHAAPPDSAAAVTPELPLAHESKVAAPHVQPSRSERLEKCQPGVKHPAGCSAQGGT